MGTVEQALETQLSNIEKKTGKSRTALMTDITASGKTKHGDIVAWLKSGYGLGHGDANTLTHFALRGGTFEAPENAAADDVLDAIYKDKKAHQRPIHEALMAAITGFGEFEIAPKQGYVSLRGKKQFAMLGPKTNDRFELGLNLKEAIDDPRVKALPPGGMCQYVVPLTDAAQVDDSLMAIVKRAYDAAG
jgi:hypothetical protein